MRHPESFLNCFIENLCHILTRVRTINLLKRGQFRPEFPLFCYPRHSHRHIGFSVSGGPPIKSPRVLSRRILTNIPDQCKPSRFHRAFYITCNSLARSVSISCAPSIIIDVTFVRCHMSFSDARLAPLIAWNIINSRKDGASTMDNG
jgi:hypothetical protein